MIEQTTCTAFKVASLQPLTTHTLKLALYTSAASLGSDTVAYTATGEVVGTGYTAGGQVVTGVTVSYSETTAFVTFDNVAWPASTITARGALLYDSTDADLAIAVLDFGADKVSSNSPFLVQLPAATATSALLRFA